MNNKYPRIGSIENRRPQGVCDICNAILLNGKKPNKRIDVQVSIFRGDDLVFKAHSECIDRFRLSKKQLIERLLEAE